MPILFWRFIQIYVIFVFLFSFFLFIGIRVLRRNPKNRLSQIFSLAFITVSISLIVNFFYPFITNPKFHSVVNLLNAIAIYLVCLGMGLLLLFTILLYKPEQIENTKNQLLFILIYSGISAGIFFIPEGTDVKITSDGTQSYPVWNLPFSFYIITVLLCSMIYTLYTGIKIVKKFKSQILAKKMKYFIIGISHFYYIGLGIPIFNYLNIEILRIIFAISGFIAIISGGLYLYHGIGASLKQPYHYYFNKASVVLNKTSNNQKI